MSEVIDSLHCQLFHIGICCSLCWSGNANFNVYFFCSSVVCMHINAFRRNHFSSTILKLVLVCCFWRLPPFRTKLNIIQIEKAEKCYYSPSLSYSKDLRT